MNSFSGYFKLSVDERLSVLKKVRNLDDHEISILKNGGSMDLASADKIVENVIGVYHLPIGLATNFKINSKDYVIPLAVEEPSVVAAASKGAKLCLPKGFSSKSDPPLMIGQIQIMNPSNSKEAVSKISSHKSSLLSGANEFLKPKEKYGIKATDLSATLAQSSRGQILITNVTVNVGNAQGANMINSLMEFLAPKIHSLVGGKVRLRILTNLATKRKTYACATWSKETLASSEIEGVLDAYAFAESDIYRCATHNKGIMNGISSAVVASGNDWRSAEAAAHAYAAISGKYSPLTRYSLLPNGDLFGEIELPLALATVGPAVNSSPIAKITQKILGVSSSGELAQVIACVGLANNFSALLALSGEGIQKGHMKLHARSVASFVGATDSEVDELAKILSDSSNYSESFAKTSLEKMRKSKKL